MAATPEADKLRRAGGNNCFKSYFQKTVCLQDWWLVKSDKDFEGKRLAVAGFTSRELQPMRVFTSAPIIKRYDVFSLETADGICVILRGFINKSRTNENGFSSEVCNYFLFGFPPHWEDCAVKYLGNDKTSGVGLESISDLEKTNSDPGHVENSIPPMDNTSMKDYAEQGQNKEDIIQAKMPRTPVRLSNSSTKSTNWQEDADNIDDLRIPVGDRESGTEERLSRKKIRRKIKFETHGGPLARNRKETTSIISPEDLGLKRSRSGRLLVPTLNFWHNQIAVYDADRRITGIQDGQNILNHIQGA